ncbi:MAG: CHAD domain-containing protein [Candidatus Thiodiazotropha sp. (ex. Lucinisca nassula)]|nr:CHAD domain-containing protein [Candidatus Thiodiazotropha sp. (ex. Lucinisca nassula)]
MPLHPISYLLPDDFDLQQLKSSFKESHGLREEVPSKVKLTYYDSFDWRVWNAGGELHEEQGTLNRLCWHSIKGRKEPISQTIDQSPGFAKDLPAGALADLLSSVLEMRVLQPKVHVIQQQQTLALLDSEEKTVVRVVLEQNSYASIDGKQSGPLEGRIVLKPLKGYQSDFEKIVAHLKAIKLRNCGQSLYQDALQGVGIKPGDYSSKLNYRLDPYASADSTARQIMLDLLNTLEANVAGTKADLDSEYLHDLRVATRRTRSAMSQIKGVFDPQQLEPFKRGFGWIGQVTGPTRDLDVYLLKYDQYRASLPEALQGDLDPFYDYLLNHQKTEQAKLVKKLNSPHFRKLIKNWRVWLEESKADQENTPNANKATAKLADKRISKLYARVLKDGLAIGPDSPAEMLHELRKDCKKLRYMMEFFQSLYPKPAIRELIKALKVILDNLGEFQDLEVQAHSLEDIGSEMLKEGAPASALMAMGVLVGRLFERQVTAREEFVNLFAAFSSEGNQKAFRKLFGGA